MPQTPTASKDNPISLKIKKEKSTITVAGRLITLKECKFVFAKIWKNAVDNCKEDHGDHYHPNFAKTVDVQDLFHVLDLTGKLLNKEEIDDHET